MVLAFYDLQRKKSDQLTSLFGATVERCMNLNSEDKFQVK